MFVLGSIKFYLCLLELLRKRTPSAQNFKRFLTL